MNEYWTRRRLIRTVLAGGAGIALSTVLMAEDNGVSQTPAPAQRYLELYNTHTDETVNVVYRIGDEHQAPAIASLRHLLRDHRSDEAHDMDLALYDQLWELAAAAKCHPHYQIISGYRSPASNSKMAARPGSGVAKKSLHMEGRAIDVRLRGCSCADLRDLALAAKKGGVGYYHRSDFVHLDTGRFRTWNG